MAKKLTELTPEEKDGILSYIGIEDFENFKDEFPKKFLTVDTAINNDKVISAVTGKRVKTIESALLDVFKLVDPTVSKSKLGEKPLETNIEELTGMLNTKFTELETKSKHGNDKRVDDLLKEKEDIQKSYIAEKEVNQRLTSEFDTFKSDSANNIKTYKVNHQITELKVKLPFIDDVTELQRVGFETILNSKYKFDLDENDKLRVLGVDGKPIQSKARAAIAEPYEILEYELEVNKLKKNNNIKQNNSIFTPKNVTPQNNGRQLSIDAQKRMSQFGK